MEIGFTLSYPIGSVVWDGTHIRKVAEDEINRSLDVLQACGIDEVMITGYHVEEPSDFDMDAETARLGKVLTSRGMRAAQHHGLSATFAAPDASQDKVIANLCRGVDFTANLGARTLVIHPGRCVEYFKTVREYYVFFERERDRHGLQRVVEVCAENLRAAGEYARQRGVTIAIENHVGGSEALGSIRELPELVALADSPAVGHCLDSGHAHCAGESVLEWIEIMGNRIHTTHFHDNHGPRDRQLNAGGIVSPGGVDEHLPPGLGTISWVDVIAALHRAGYSHTVNFESGGWPGWGDEDGLRRAVDYWRTCERLAADRLSKASR